MWATITPLLLVPVVSSLSLIAANAAAHRGHVIAATTCTSTSTCRSSTGSRATSSTPTCEVNSGLVTFNELQFTEVNIGNGKAHTGNDIDSYSTNCTSSVGGRIKSGESVLQIEGIVTEDECRALCEVCCQLDEERSNTVLEKEGLLRLPTIAAAERAAVRNTPCADPLPLPIDGMLQRILFRVARTMDKKIPSIGVTLFNGEKVAKLMADQELKYSSREPAINVYSRGGEFRAHKDAQSITVLIPLSSPNDFVGGGTSFWSQDSRGHRVEAPSVCLKPPPGTAMLFGGCVTHAGVKVKSGKRVVFVASFSNAKSDQPPSAIEEQRDVYGDSM